MSQVNSTPNNVNSNIATKSAPRQNKINNSNSGSNYNSSVTNLNNANNLNTNSGNVNLLETTPANAKPMNNTGTASNTSANTQQLTNDINRLLLDYLNKKGYHRMEAMLRAESGRTLTPKNRNSPASPKYSNFLIPNESKIIQSQIKPISNDTPLLPSKRSLDDKIITTDGNHSITENSPASFVLDQKLLLRSYILLNNWIMKSLSIYKDTLIDLVLYPYFLHTMINLTNLGSFYIAKSFYERHIDIVLKDSNETKLKDFYLKFLKTENDPTVKLTSDEYQFHIIISERIYYPLLSYLLENERIGGYLILKYINNYLTFHIIKSLNENTIQHITDTNNNFNFGDNKEDKHVFYEIKHEISVTFNDKTNILDNKINDSIDPVNNNDIDKKEGTSSESEVTSKENEINSKLIESIKNIDGNEEDENMTDVKELSKSPTNDITITGFKADKVEIKNYQVKDVEDQDTKIKVTNNQIDEANIIQEKELENIDTMNMPSIQTHEINEAQALDTYTGTDTTLSMEEKAQINNYDSITMEKQDIKKSVVANLNDNTNKLGLNLNSMVSEIESESKSIRGKNIKTLEFEIQKFKESHESLKLNDLQVSLPSVSMYTYHNTERNMASLEFSNDYRRAAAGFQDSYVKVWSLDGSPLDKQETIIDNIESTSRTLVSHTGPVYSTSFSPCDRFLLSASEDKTARLWSLDDYTPLVVYKGHDKPVWDISFSPTGNNYFATASNDQTARLWSCDHLYPLRIMAGHLGDVECLSFHPNGRYIFTGSSDKTCRMWDINAGDSVRLFMGHTSPITSTSVSPDGRWLSTGADDGTITVWDIGTGKKIKNMRGHGKNSVHSLSYNKDGNVLVSSGADHSVRVWDLKKNTYEPSLEPEDIYPGYVGNDNVSSMNQDIKEYSRRRTVIATNDLLASFFTKKTPVFSVKFTTTNLLLAGGPSITD